MELGFALPLSCPSGADGEPDGIFGDETYRQVVAFQKQSFPGNSNQWDGRVGKLTLAEMDESLPTDEPDGPIIILPACEVSSTRCDMTTPTPGRHDIFV
jgi:peptidoglycan hydrolase-like protein with peptidoglycan-binding domain